MIWRSLICSSLALATLPAAVVTGTVTLRDAKAPDRSGVVVWLTPAQPSSTPVAQTSLKATMIQRNKKFIPHVLPIRTGTAVDFPNYDPIFHNAFSNFSGQIFDVGLYKPGTSRTVTFRRPGVVRIFCNIHANMSAVLVVVDSPYYASTAPSGTFEIPDVPPGTYEMNVFHERATAEELRRLARTIHVSNSENPPPLGITISEAGYLPTPHLNKHGRPYPASSETYKVVR